MNLFKSGFVIQDTIRIQDSWSTIRYESSIRIVGYESNLLGVRIHGHNTLRIHGFAKQIHVFTNLLYDSRILTNKSLATISLHKPGSLSDPTFGGRRGRDNNDSISWWQKCKDVGFVHESFWIYTNQVILKNKSPKTNWRKESLGFRLQIQIRESANLDSWGLGICKSVFLRILFLL